MIIKLCSWKGNLNNSLIHNRYPGIAENTETSEFSCIICSSEFNLFQDGTDHLISVHGIRETPEKIRKDLMYPTKLISIFCKLCEFRTDSTLEKVRLECRAHIQEQHSDRSSIKDGFRLMCRVCRFSTDKVCPEMMSFHFCSFIHQVWK